MIPPGASTLKLMYRRSRNVLGCGYDFDSCSAVGDVKFCDGLA